MVKQLQVKTFKGVTLLELLLALAVIAALLFIAVRYYVNARENAKVAQAAYQISMAAEASYRWLEMQNQTDFCGGADVQNCTNPIRLEKLVAAGLLNKSDLISPWTNRTTFGLSEMPGHPKYVAIGYSQLPEKACKSLEQKFRDKVVIINDRPEVACWYQHPITGWEFHGAF